MSIFRHPVPVPSTVVGLLCLIATFLVGVPVVISVVVGVVLGGFCAAGVTRRAEGVLRRALGVRPALVGEFPRLFNTIAGLCLQVMALAWIYQMGRQPVLALLQFPRGCMEVSRILRRGAEVLRTGEPVVWGGREYVLEAR